MRSIVLVVVLGASPAFAQLSARVEPGTGLMLSSPQRAFYAPGFSGVLALQYGLAPWADAVAQLSYALLPTAGASNPFGAPSSYLTIGAGARVARPRTGSTVVPWAELVAQYVRTGALDRVGFSAALGAMFGVGHGVWVGPALRLQYVLRVTDEPQFPTRDAAVLGLALTVEYARPGEEAPPPPPPVAVAPPPPPPVTVTVVHAPADADGDGLADGDDACPHVYGQKEDRGCPRYTQIVVTEKKIELRQKIFFAFGLATVLPRSYPLLDEVVQALRDRERLCVRVDGHTDAVGGVDRNLRLSQERTEAVRAYLTGKGIDGATLSAQGYGSSLPLETNSTPEGREQNRRVEFLIVPCAEVQT